MPGDGCNMAAVLAALDRADCRTPDRLAAATGLERRAVIKGAGKLIGRGLAERAERGCYRLTAEGEVWRASGRPFTSGPWRAITQPLKRPRRVTFQDKLWRGLRASGRATVPQLLALSDRDGRPAQQLAQQYLRTLNRAGYVRKLPRRDRASATAPSSNGYAVWLLVRDTGPLAPSWRRSKGDLWDPNLREAVALADRAPGDGGAA